MLDTSEVEYETTSALYEALEKYTTILKEENVNKSLTNTTWPSYDVCNPNASSEDFLNSSIFQSCIYFMYSTVFLIALVGNGLVCFVVKTSPRMKTVTNYFIVNLAVGDILMTLFCVPFSFVSMLVLRYWPFGLIMCKIVNYSQAVSVLVSAYTLLAISIDRYMAIMRPLKPRLGKAAAKTVVAAVWGGALATAAPISVVSQLERPTPWHQFCQADICLEQWEHTGQSAQYTCALLVLQFALPLVALIATYARIACAVWGGRPPGEAQDARDTRLQRSKRKMVKMMVIVVTVFTMCWLPLNMFIVLWTVHEQDENWGMWPGMPYVWFASHWLAMSHSCYNPIIYCYMNTRYRRGFKQAFACLFRIRLDTPSRHRSSVCEGVQMSALELHYSHAPTLCLTRTCTRAIRGYRTVSADAACTLAGTPPWDLEAEVLADVYRRAVEFWAGGRGRPLPKQVREWREAARRGIVARWSVRLEAPRAGLRTVEALRPVLSLWVLRQHGTLSFRLVQVLSGHGCFGYYLHKVARREPSPFCHNCDCGEDTLQHTLEVCPAWEQQRRVLIETVGADLSLSAVIRSTVDGER